MKPGQRVTWHVVKSLVVVHAHKKIKDPVRFLTSQTDLDVDAVRLVREARRIPLRYLDRNVIVYAIENHPKIAQMKEESRGR